MPEYVAELFFPVLMSVIAVALVMYQLFRREEQSGAEEQEPTPSKEPSPSKEAAPSKELRKPPKKKAKGRAKPADAARPLPSVVDLNDDLLDDEFEITLMGLVPDEIASKMKPAYRGVAADEEVDDDPTESDITDIAEAARDTIDDTAQALILVTGVARSDRGRKRACNEDAYLALERPPLFVVADGMGGYAGGEVASQLTIDVIEQAFRTGKFQGRRKPGLPRLGAELVQALEMAHEAVKIKKETDPKYQEMGTTAVAIRFSRNNQKAYIANVGDSRCYRVRDGELVQLTTDHNLATLLGVKGRRGRMLSQAIGVRSAIAVDLHADEPMAGDLYVVCSDGLTKMIDDDRILEVAAMDESLDKRARRMIDDANEAGGRDNITAIVIRVDNRTTIGNAQ